MLIKKDDLAGYSTFLEGLFGPSAQFRISRRRKLTSKIRDSPKIKYVIDLTPPNEGEEAVYLMTELCCSEGVRLWYQASDIWRVSETLVGGKEEYISQSCQSSPGRRSSSLKAANEPMPLEYTPVRHRSAIERVIAALVGIDPKLDSAPKLWTTFAVAKYFGITKSPLTDFVIRWLRAYPNSFFLEVCPEVSLRIAEGFENHDLARDTFAILVGEEALDSLCRTRLQGGSRERSTYGRRKEDLPESFYTRVEYASKNFLERIGNDFDELVGDEMRWIDNLGEVNKLSSYLQPELQNTIKALKDTLKEYVRGTIYKLLCYDYECVPSPEFHHPGGEDLIPRWSRAEVWMKLSASERIMSRTFWKALISFDIFEGSTNLNVKFNWGNGSNRAPLSSEEKRQMALGTYRKVHSWELNYLVEKGTRLLANSKQRASFTLPDRTRPQDDVTSANLDSVSDILQPLANKVNESFDWAVSSFMPFQPIDIPKSASKKLPRPQKRDLSPTRHDSLDLQENARKWPLGALREEHAMQEKRHEGGDKVTQNHQQLKDEYWDSVDTQPPWPTASMSELPSYTDDLGNDQEKAFKTELDGEDKQQGLRNWWEYSALPDVSNSARPSGIYIPPKKNSVSPPSKTPRLNSQSVFHEVTPFFDLRKFSLEAKSFLQNAAGLKLQNADQTTREEAYKIGITNTLVCLQENEWKFLPLWAGGYDDGTGGVFNDQIPTTDLGFSTPGPEVHTGMTPANSSRDSSEFEMVDSEHDADSTNLSMANHRGFSDALQRQRVYAADSVGSSTVEGFDLMTLNSSEGGDASGHLVKQIEGQRQMQANSEEAVGVVRNEECVTARMTDESYEDLFDDDLYDDDSQTEMGDSNMDEEEDEDDTVLI